MEELPESYLRTSKAWLLLPVLGYLVAIPFLGPGAFFVPAVILNAPLGILGFFEKVTLDGDSHQNFTTTAHLIFWGTLMVGHMGRNRIHLRWLRTAWWFLVVLLVMSISGCAIHLGPGLRDPGNWH